MAALASRFALLAAALGLIACATAPAVAQTNQNDRHVGKRVRITMLDGTRQSGDLVVLDDTEVVISTSRARLRYALVDVRLVQIERLRALPFAVLFGTGAAGLTAWSYTAAGEGTSRQITREAAIWGSVAAGGGALLGRWMEASSAAERTLYPAPKTRR